MSKLEKELAKRLAGFENKVAKVGWFPTAIYPEDEGGRYVAEVAMIQEHGAPAANIPPRPFIKPTINEKSKQWANDLEKGARAVMRGATTAENVLQIVGAKAAGDIRKTISEIRSPSLSPITLMLRKWKDEDPSFKVDGFMVGVAAHAVKDGEDYSLSGMRSQPLNDTGLMIATCTNVVGAPE